MSPSCREFLVCDDVTIRVVMVFRRNFLSLLRCGRRYECVLSRLCRIWTDSCQLEMNDSIGRRYDHQAGCSMERSRNWNWKVTVGHDVTPSVWLSAQDLRLIRAAPNVDSSRIRLYVDSRFDLRVRSRLTVVCAEIEKTNGDVRCSSCADSASGPCALHTINQSTNQETFLKCPKQLKLSQGLLCKGKW